MSETTCPWHGEVIGGQAGSCGVCLSEMAGPIPESSGGRADEIERLMDEVLTVKFEVLHERMERLVGRPVWTHEFAHPEYLVHEVRTGTQPSMEGIIAKLPADKPVVMVTPDD